MTKNRLQPLKASLLLLLIMFFQFSQGWYSLKFTNLALCRFTHSRFAVATKKLSNFDCLFLLLLFILPSNLNFLDWPCKDIYSFGNHANIFTNFGILRAFRALALPPLLLLYRPTGLATSSFLAWHFQHFCKKI